MMIIVIIIKVIVNNEIIITIIILHILLLYLYDVYYNYASIMESICEYHYNIVLYKILKRMIHLD